MLSDYGYVNAPDHRTYVSVSDERFLDFLEAWINLATIGIIRQRGGCMNYDIKSDGREDN